MAAEAPRADALALTRRVARLLYVLVAALLFLFSLAMLGIALWQIVVAAGQGWDALQRRVLDGIGLVVIAIAVFDVSRFILEEEIVRRRMLDSPGEARRSLTKVMTIIVIATCLEALARSSQSTGARSAASSIPPSCSRRGCWRSSAWACSSS